MACNLVQSGPGMSRLVLLIMAMWAALYTYVSLLLMANLIDSLKELD